MTDDKLRELLLDHADFVVQDYQLGAENSPATAGTVTAILAMFAAERKLTAELIEAMEAPGYENHNCANSKCLAAQKRRLDAIEKARKACTD